MRNDVELRRRLFARITSSGKGFNPNQIVDSDGQTVGIRTDGDLIGMIKQAVRFSRGVPEDELFPIEVGIMRGRKK